MEIKFYFWANQQAGRVTARKGLRRRRMADLLRFKRHSLRILAVKKKSQNNRANGATGCVRTCSVTYQKSRKTFGAIDMKNTWTKYLENTWKRMLKSFSAVLIWDFVSLSNLYWSMKDSTRVSVWWSKTKSKNCYRRLNVKSRYSLGVCSACWSLVYLQGSDSGSGLMPRRMAGDPCGSALEPRLEPFDRDGR